MNDKNQETQKREGSQKSSETVVAANQFSWKKFLAKKWVFPATYIAAAAIILTLMWAFQNSGTDKAGGDLLTDVPGEQTEAGVGAPSDAWPVAGPVEDMAWPVEDRDALEIAMPFYDPEASAEQNAAAMIEDGDTFIPSVGISLKRQDDAEFDVFAALSGTVTRADTHPKLGHLVEITHNNGIKTIYYSLADVTVEEGEQVEQGDLIAKAGRNDLEKMLGVHLHFEVYQNDQPVNPETFIAQATNSSAN